MICCSSWIRTLLTKLVKEAVAGCLTVENPPFLHHVSRYHANFSCHSTAYRGSIYICQFAQFLRENQGTSIQNTSKHHFSYMVVSWNVGTPSHHPFSWDFPYEPSMARGTPIYGNPHIGKIIQIIQTPQISPDAVEFCQDIAEVFGDLGWPRPNLSCFFASRGSVLIGTIK